MTAGETPAELAIDVHPERRVDVTAAAPVARHRAARQEPTRPACRLEDSTHGLDTMRPLDGRHQVTPPVMSGERCRTSPAIIGATVGELGSSSRSSSTRTTGASSATA